MEIQPGTELIKNVFGGLHEFMGGTINTITNATYNEDPRASPVMKNKDYSNTNIYDEKRKLMANYPVTVEIKSKSGKKYILFKSKSDYTRPEKKTFYKCEKVNNY